MQIMTTDKQPWEVVAIGVNFHLNMEDDEIIDVLNSEVKIYDYYTNEEVTDEMLKGDIFVTDDTILLAHIQNGTNGGKYKVSFRAYISSNKRLEEDLQLKVKD